MLVRVQSGPPNRALHLAGQDAILLKSSQQFESVSAYHPFVIDYSRAGDVGNRGPGAQPNTGPSM